jgi:hypothetical protein
MKRARTETAALLMVVLAGITMGITAGCATRSTDISSDQMIGVVYAEDGTPVAGAEIRVDRHRRAVSDTFGRFRVAGVPAGPREVSVTAEGYETAYREVRFENRAKLVRVDLVSYTALVDRILHALEERRWQEARRIARRMETVDPLDPRTLLVHRILQAPEAEGGAR